jgi:hypothetical protein
MSPTALDFSPYPSRIGNHTYHKSRVIDPNAPTEERNYVIPSATSRKEIPVRFAEVAKSRASSIKDEVDELRDDSPPSIDPTLVEQIKDRRRRNTISARKSRQRRLEQMGELEKERNDLLKVVHEYRDYILRLRECISSQGISTPDPPFTRPFSSERFNVSFQVNHN